MGERLALPTSVHGVAGSNPAGGEILPEPKRRFIAQSFSCSSFHRLEVTEILLKGRKTLTHPSNQKRRKVIDHFCIKKVRSVWLLASPILITLYWEPATKVRGVWLLASPILITCILETSCYAKMVNLYDHLSYRVHSTKYA